ncbi:MAG: hypothetical protein FH753_10230 [Firmicutes bacterium]|nr:hypothetical protein [Bacillota bacterium]
MTQIIGKLNPLAIFLIGLIVAIFFIAIVASIIVRKKYKNIGQAIQDIKEGREDLNKYHVLKSIVRDYKMSAERNLDEVNTQAIIEHNFNSELSMLYLVERFVKNSVSLMIILGLLGTFYGLTLSIGDLVKLLGNGANSEALNSIDSIVGGLINSVEGMSVAFVTSLFGIASSVVITIVNILVNLEETREAVMVKMEEYLDNKVALEFKRPLEKQYDMVTGELRTIFKDFGSKMEDNFKYVINTQAENLSRATKEMESASVSLLKAIKDFDSSLETFSENTRDFSEFNHHLKTNIERMNVAFSDFTDDIKENKESETYKEIAIALDKLNKKIR